MGHTDWLGVAFPFFFFFSLQPPIPKLTQPSEKKKEGKKKKKKKTTQLERKKEKEKRRRRRPPSVKGKKKKKKKTGFDYLHAWVPQICVYLPNFHHNSVSITQKHLKVVFSFHNSSLKNQRIEWWKQKLKTNPNKPNSRGTQQFWDMGDENRVMDDGNTKSKQPPNNPLFTRIWTYGKLLKNIILPENFFIWQPCKQGYKHYFFFF